MYLNSNLSIRKMWTLFQEEGNHDCTYKFYYRIFVKKYNLGFGTPATDVCSDCTKWEAILALEADEEEKKVVKDKLWIHKVASKKFYDLLDDFDPTDLSIRTLVFDLMQNQVLPKTAIGEAFYSRQLYQYFLGIINHHGKQSKQSRDDVVFYSWGEHEAGRGSNTITSALYDYIVKFVPPEVKTLRLFSDSSAGQNKNYTMIAMLSSLAQERKIKISFSFPIRGHSYLPVDRAFGRVEKLLRKINTILTPTKYFETFSEVGSVRCMFKDFELYDWKSYQKVMKSQQTLKISEARVLEINGIQVGVKDNYYAPTMYHSVLGRGKKCLPRHLNKVTASTHVSQEKKNDVTKLLQKMGVGERNSSYSFYTDALKSVAAPKRKKT